MRVLVIDAKANNMPLGFLDDAKFERFYHQREFQVRGAAYLPSRVDSILKGGADETVTLPPVATLRWVDCLSRRPDGLKRFMAEGLVYRARLLQCLDGQEALFTIPPPEFCSYAEMFGNPSRD